MKGRLGLLVIGLALLACSGSRKGNYENASVRQSGVPEVVADTSQQPVVVAEEPASASVESPVTILYEERDGFVEPVSNFDVIHTVLDISFDFQRQRVLGTALHRVKVVSDQLREVWLDALDMEFQSVSVKKNDASPQPANIQVEEGGVRILLPEAVLQNEIVEVSVTYIAHPTRNGKNLGLVFVDPLDMDPAKPTQIWTLGQPEDNQYWFPAWDYPNDRMTVELSLTVPQKFTTIANGELLNQAPISGNLRKDTWVLERPHVSYLTGFAVGEYAVETEAYVRNDGSSVPLAYFVEPKHASNAILTFGETDQMMRFFEENLGVRYPWPNYKQVSVHDFTARGMENTSASIMYEALQHDERAHLDYTGRDLITHELAHQWFGNLVTSRNWANLPLNEGFASYAERLYLESQYGLAVAQKHTLEDRAIYLEEAKSLQRPVIWYGYDDPNTLYDRHTYQKAALVLHQLRYEMGDALWWQGVRRYLRENAYREVVLEDFRTAMEQAAGVSLGGFFNQWYSRPGHPELLVEHSYDRNRGFYEIHVTQLQDSLRIGNFAFNVDIEVNVVGAQPWTQRYRVASRDTTFRFGIAGTISFVRFDAGDWLLAEVTSVKDLSEWMNQMRLDDEMASRYDAVQAINQFERSDQVKFILLETLEREKDSYVRSAIVEGLSSYSDENDVRDALLRRVQSDEDSAVRLSALRAMSGVNDLVFLNALKSALNDQSYVVVAEAVKFYAGSYRGDVVPAIRHLFNVESWQYLVELAVIDAYGSLAALEGIPYLQKHVSFVYDEKVQIASLGALSRIALQHLEVRSSIAQTIMDSMESVNEAVRYAAAVALQPIHDSTQRGEIQRYLQSEPSPRVRQQLELLIAP